MGTSTIVQRDIDPFPRIPAKYWASAVSGVVGLLLSFSASYLGFHLHFNLAAIGFVQLFVVLIIALHAGFVPATLVSVAANVCLIYFFVPPIFTFAIEDPKNWVALLVFEASALLVSRLSAAAQKQTQAARAHQAELEKLYQLARQMLHLRQEPAVATQILEVIRRLFDIRGAALFDAEQAAMMSVGEIDDVLSDEIRTGYIRNRDADLEGGESWIRILRVGSKPIGTLGLRGCNLNRLTADAIASIVAITIERVRSLERENRAEAEHELELLRTAVLDALAHDYKSPLTEMRTVATGLMEMEDLSPVHRDLLAIVDSNIEHLDRLTTRILQTARLDRADLRLNKERVYMDDLISATISSMRRGLNGRRLEIAADRQDVWILGDRELISTAIAQFVDNAVKYSDPESTITIAVQALEQEVQISVHNRGPLIRAEDQKRVFQRYYRSNDPTYSPAGSGIGLSITKRVADVHRGRVWVKSEEGRGNTFFLMLPIGA